MGRVIAGPERKGRVMNGKTKHTIAYHESGHARGRGIARPCRSGAQRSRSSRAAGRWATPSPFPTRTRFELAFRDERLGAGGVHGRPRGRGALPATTSPPALNDLERASKWPAVCHPVRHEPSGHSGVRPAQPRVFLGRDYNTFRITRDGTIASRKRWQDLEEAHDRAIRFCPPRRSDGSHGQRAARARDRGRRACEAAARQQVGRVPRRARTSSPPRRRKAAAPRQDAELLAAKGGRWRERRRAQRVAQAHRSIPTPARRWPTRTGTAR